MQIKVLFFASFKQHLNCDQLSLEVSSGDTVEVICESLAQRGPEWLELFGNSKSKVKVSINQEMANFQDILSDGDEIAFFSTSYWRLSRSNLAVSEMKKEILITDSALDISSLVERSHRNQGESGAVVTFTGAVRVSNEESGLVGMTLEHYPGMTESQLDKILDKVSTRWPLNAARVVHRVGYLTPGQPIVFVSTTGLHRKEAFEAAEFIMDYLKRDATFWKKEHYVDKAVWVEAKESDSAAIQRWES